MNIKKISSSVLLKKRTLKHVEDFAQRKNATSAKISWRNGTKYIAGIIFALIFDVEFDHGPENKESFHTRPCSMFSIEISYCVTILHFDFRILNDVGTWMISLILVNRVLAND